MDRRLLTRVVLRNYKSIAACNVAPAQLSFLVGANGSGKSNFLDALRFVAGFIAILDRPMRCATAGGSTRCAAGRAAIPRTSGSAVAFNLGESWGHYAFEVGAKPQGGFEVQREECYVLRRDGDQPQFYEVEGRDTLPGARFPSRRLLSLTVCTSSTPRVSTLSAPCTMPFRV